MALSVIGSVTTFTSSAAVTTLTNNKPAGVLPGDLLLWSMVGQTVTISPGNPVGFAVLQTGSVAGCYEAVYSRIADGTEGASFTSQTLTSSKYAATLIAIRGADPTFINDVAAPAAVTGTTASTFPAITPVSPGAWVMGFGGQQFAAGVTVGTVSSTNLTMDGNVASTGASANVLSAIGHFVWSSGAFTPTMANTAVMAHTVSISTAVRPARGRRNGPMLQAVNRAAVI